MRNAITSLIFALMLLPACNGGDDDSGTNGGSDGTDGTLDGTDGTDGTGGDELVAIDGMPNGTFYVNFALAPVGGLLVPFQAEVQSLQDTDGARTIQLDFKATDADAANFSEVLLSVTADLAEDGSWSAPETRWVLPGVFAPTGSDVEVSVAMWGSASTAEGFCGTLTGQIVTFEMDLEGSTFGAVSWDDRDDGAEGSCSAGDGGYDPIAVCPTLTHGTNTGFLSADLDRSFDLVIPDQYDGSRDWPLVFAFHGLGGSVSGMLDDVELRPMANERGVILAVPTGADFGGNPGWDAANPPGANRDLQYFDDMLTCLNEQYAIDADRVYATGMSNGGMMTGAVLAHRSEVVAAVAPFSGGVISAWPDEASKVPTLIVWGGVDDEAYDQDIHALNQTLIAQSEARGHFYAMCDHGLGHELRAEFWPWTFDFLLDHPRGIYPSPYAAGLPDSFPSYCTLPESDPE